MVIRKGKTKTRELGAISTFCKFAISFSFRNLNKFEISFLGLIFLFFKYFQGTKIVFLAKVGEIHYFGDFQPISLLFAHQLDLGVRPFPQPLDQNKVGPERLYLLKTHIGDRLGKLVHHFFESVPGEVAFPPLLQDLGNAGEFPGSRLFYSVQKFWVSIRGFFLPKWKTFLGIFFLGEIRAFFQFISVARFVDLRLIAYPELSEIGCVDLTILVADSLTCLSHVFCYF